MTPKKINEISGMPQMGVAFNGWLNTITLKKITQEVKNGFVTDSEEDISFKGVVQPLSAKNLMLKSEGQRAFQWLQIHCFSTELNLKVNDRIKFKDKIYKLMNIWSWELNNFIEYHIVEDFQE